MDSADIDAQERAAFQIGGVDRELTEDEQLEQLGTYLDAHHPYPADNLEAADRYSARLPDRITHASMLMLGAGLNHSMPGQAYAQDVDVQDTEYGQVLTPPEPNGMWAVSLHSGGWRRGSGEPLEMAWRPEVAAIAALSGVTIVDVDYPLLPAHSVDEVVAAVRRSLEWARTQADQVALIGYSSGGALAALLADDADALVLIYPDFASLDGIPSDLRGEAQLPTQWPPTLLQWAIHDEVATKPEIPGATVRTYTSRHRISTPAVARQRVEDAAEFLRNRR